MIIGIDPDVEKSGIAWYNSHTGEFEVLKMKFFEAYEWMNELKNIIELVRIEAGWINQKSNFHSYKGGIAKGERIAKNVGSNHEVGRKFGEMCEHLGIEYEFVKPLGTKNIDHFTFKKLTGFQGRTNQDMRDAGMLCYGYKIDKYSKLFTPKI